MNRRDFVKGTVLSAAVARLAAQGSAPAKGKVPPGDRITVAVIGSGARAQQLLDAALTIPVVEITAVCDAYSGRAQRAQERTAGRAKIHKDYREILNDKSIDAVIIGTPDHWHKDMAIQSMEAGKDVYIEKPLTYAVDEGLEIIDAVKKTKRVLQVGSQGISSATQQKARELVKAGRLGRVTMIRASYNRNTAEGAWLYPIPPDASTQTVDWDAFLGPAPKRPFDLERFFRWRCYWDYSGGISTDLFVHLVTSIHFIMDAKMPKSVVATGELYRWKESREVPDTVNGIMVYPEGFTVNLSSTFNNQSSSDSGFEILGTEGSISFRGGQFVFRPENVHNDYSWVVDSWPKALAEAYYREPKVQSAEVPTTWKPRMNQQSEVWDEQGQDATIVHLDHFFDSVKSRQQPIEDALTGHRAAACAHMVNASLRQNKAVQWDFGKEKLIS